MDLFGIDVAGLVASEMGDGLHPITLTKIEEAAPPRSRPTAAPETSETDYPCRGIVQDYSEFEQRGDKVRGGDRKVLILAGTLPTGIVPTTNDKITVPDGQVFRVCDQGVKSDPASATYVCQVRR